uniref:Uncharacterized protein n=1 Tax=Rhizophora mucronata TaxID=61149 RepID=A0A2P2IYX5_RHIMU
MIRMQLVQFACGSFFWGCLNRSDGLHFSDMIQALLVQFWQQNKKKIKVFEELLPQFCYSFKNELSRIDGAVIRLFKWMCTLLQYNIQVTIVDNVGVIDAFQGPGLKM